MMELKKIIYDLKRIVCYVLLAVSILVAGFGENSFAQTPTYKVSANVTTRSAVLGSSLQFGLKVEGTQDISAPELPELDGFKARYIGPSRQVTLINGQVSNSITFQYALVPTKTGELTIPSLTLNFNGQNYVTEAISIKVFDSPQSAKQNNLKTIEKTLDEKVFIILNIAQQDVYVHQRVPIKALFYKTGVNVADLRYPEVEEKNFVLEPFSKYRKGTQSIKEQAFDVVEFDTYLFPLREGELDIGPLTMDLSLVSAGSRQRFSNNAFNDKFFDSFFNSQKKTPIQIKSKIGKINVKELPVENKPENFSKAVGQFDFAVEASPLDIKVGDPITVKMLISGDGLLKAIAMPEFVDSNEFKVYEPVIKERENKKYLEQVIIPKSINVKEIPAVSFSYFDPNTKQYKTITKGPWPINVSKAEQGESLGLSNFNDSSLDILQPEKVGEDIIFIKDNFGKWQSTSKKLYQTTRYGLSVVVVLLIAGGLLVYYMRVYRFTNDPNFMNRLQAPKIMKQNMEKAKQKLEANQQREFYDRIHTDLQTYLAQMLQLSIGNLDSAHMMEKLSHNSKLQDTIVDIQYVFDECEMVCYASVSKDRKQMDEVYHKTLRIVASIQKEVKL